LKAGCFLRDFKYIWPHSSGADFYFNSSSRDFSVEEVPLYDFSNNGEHLILKVRKKNLTTWDMLNILSSHLGISKKDIGYAGLKDKNAITIQYISIPKKYENKINNFNHPEIKILDKTYHKNKIKIGHLRGNNFWVRLKRVKGVQKTKIESLLNWIKQNGMPNYFGLQRFGIKNKNYLEGKAIIEGKLKIKDKKIKKFLISAYQSYLFNNLLAKRVEISNLLNQFSYKEVEHILNFKPDSLKSTKLQKNYFKLLDGDLFMHYPFGKIFYEDMEVASKRFLNKDISPTGLIAGKKVKLSKDLAFSLEKEYNIKINENGSRRYFWIFPQIFDIKYIEQNAWMELKFFLPKGSYATVLIDFLKGNS
jgi:tRNA pseudouridine13 synthase